MFAMTLANVIETHEHKGDFKADSFHRHALFLSRQTLSAARFLCRMRIAASSARRFNWASPGVNRQNSKSRLLISSSPVSFAPSFVLISLGSVAGCRQLFIRMHNESLGVVAVRR
jgi:hypothetical protein